VGSSVVPAAESDTVDSVAERGWGDAPAGEASTPASATAIAASTGRAGIERINRVVFTDRPQLLRVATISHGYLRRPSRVGSRLSGIGYQEPELPPPPPPPTLPPEKPPPPPLPDELGAVCVLANEPAL